MQPFGQVPAFEDGDLKLFGKVYISFYAIADSTYTLMGDMLNVHDLLIFILLQNQGQLISTLPTSMLTRGPRWHPKTLSRKQS
jgi:hypothetical protein